MTRFTDKLPADEPSNRGRRPLHYVALTIFAVAIIVIVLAVRG